jgi:hypothetical protein
VRLAAAAGLDSTTVPIACAVIAALSAIFVAWLSSRRPKDKMIDELLRHLKAQAADLEECERLRSEMELKLVRLQARRRGDTAHD